MFEFLLKLLPEWVMPVIFGALVWFGVNYAFIAPEIGRRTVENTCPANQLNFCRCVASHMISNARLPLSLWTASMGLYQVSQSAEILTARQQGAAQCQK